MADHHPPPTTHHPLGLAVFLSVVRARRPALNNPPK